MKMSELNRQHGIVMDFSVNRVGMVVGFDPVNPEKSRKSCPLVLC